MVVHIGVVVLVDVDEFKRPEIDRVGSVRPGAVEKVGVKDLQRQRHPAARRGAVQHAGVRLADAAIFLLDIGDQFLRDRVAVGAVVVGIDLVRIAIGAGAVQLKHHHARRVVGQPRLAERDGSSILSRTSE